MTGSQILVLVLKVSIVLTVMAIGLKATFSEAIFLFQRPKRLFRSFLSMNIVMLVFAVLVVAVFNLHPAVEMALVAVALAPVPPILPNKILKAGGTEAYALGLLVVAAVLSIVFVPLLLAILARLVNRPLGMPPLEVAKAVSSTVVVPLLVGMAIRALAPGFSEKIVKPLALIATIMLMLAGLVLMAATWPTVWSLIGNGSILAMAAFAVVGLAAGHLLAGPPIENRAVLALCTTSRHPGIALAIAHTNFAQPKLVMPAILLYVLVATIVTIPYLQWVRRKHSALVASRNGQAVNQASHM
jgi:bile acid:Na+ symporter, BASS family